MKYIKPKKLIPGKWYYTEYGKIYFKFRKFSTEKGYVEIFYDISTTSNYPDYFCNTDYSDTIVEIKDYSKLRELFPEEQFSYEIY